MEALGDRVGRKASACPLHPPRPEVKVAAGLDREQESYSANP